MIQRQLAEVLEEFAHQCDPGPQMAQASSCESRLLENLMGLGEKLALQAADALTEEIQGYIKCRFVGMTPQSALEAQALGDQIGAIIKDCALGNWRLFLTGGWQAYAAAVARCAVGKLLGGGLGGIFGPANPAPNPHADFQTKTLGRCGH